jgi:hypothetical protein
MGIIPLLHNLFGRVLFVSTRILLLIVVLSSPNLFTPNAAPAASAHSDLTVAELVNPDGTLNLRSGYNGTLDLTGWQVTLDTKRGPLFTPSETHVWQPFPNGGLDDIGSDYGVYALAVVGQNLYVGGVFMQTADGLVTDLNGIARFNNLTQEWSALPNQGLAGWVQALAVIGSDLFVGGTFIETADGSLTGLGRIARYSISDDMWYALPNGGFDISADVHAFAVVEDELYVGGSFLSTGDASIFFPNIAKFHTGTWSALPNIGLNSSVYTFGVSGDDLYVGGPFDSTWDGAVVDLNHIARINLTSSTWFALPHQGLNSEPQAFAIIGDDLYVGGQFTGTSDGQVTDLNHIARLSADSWSALPENGLNDQVFSLVADGTDLYVGGMFTQTANGSTTGLNNIALFNSGSNTWAALSNLGLNDSVRTLEAGGGYLVVGGQFHQTVDGAVTELNHIAAYSIFPIYDVFLPIVMR